MKEYAHDPLQCVDQLRQILSADKLSVGFFLGAGCPCAVRVGSGTAEAPLIPDIKKLTLQVHTRLGEVNDVKTAYAKLMQSFAEDSIDTPNIGRCTPTH